MFLLKQPKKAINSYISSLKCLGALSRIFSSSDVPFLYYRAHEKIFCRSLLADDRSRSDLSVDATKDGLGVGVKTFIEGNGKSYQKIAEFDADMGLLLTRDPKQVAEKIAELRNERLDYTKRIYGLQHMEYHCVARKAKTMTVYEQSMDKIDINNLKKIQSSAGNLYFSDGLNEYNFSLSKSTLLKRFVTPDKYLQIPIEIIDDPFELIEGLFNFKESGVDRKLPKEKSYEFVILPLYSLSRGCKIVHEKSALNQWNASGRPRHDDEVYIQIPAIIHSKYKGFFPARERAFKLRLPNRKFISAKVCQQGGKALMSNPNKDLGKWILRDVLNLKHGAVLTYDRLREAGVDSVIIYKYSDKDYEIDFRPVGAYESFLEQ